MRNVKILDCTLRDGGRIINCAFPDPQIKRITYLLEQSGIDIIEVGFLRDWHNVKYNGNSTFFTNEKQIVPFLPSNRVSMFVAFIDYGMYDFSSLEKCDGSSIDGIRFGFTKKNMDESSDDVIQCAKLIQEKGYKLLLQGVNSLNYTDLELLQLADTVNEIHPYSFGIVDTYGAMFVDDVQRLYTLLDHNLASDIAIDFHSHNNYQLSYSFAQEIIKLSNGVRNVIIDATLRGMGKGAGNANTELVADYLTRRKGYPYDVEKLLEIIDLDIFDYFRKKPWGYSPSSFMAGIFRSHPNNISYLLDKYRYSTNDIGNILSMLSNTERERYPYDKIDLLCEQYRFGEYDDQENRKKLKEQIGKRPVLVLAPGKTLISHKSLIDNFIRTEHPYIISVNFISQYQESIPFFGNKKRYYSFGYEENRNVIVTSDIAFENEMEFIFSAKKLCPVEKRNSRSSMFMLLLLLIQIDITRIKIAGMDGFSENHMDNYFDQTMMVDRSPEEIKESNMRLQGNLDEIIQLSQGQCKIDLITPSIFII